MVDSSPSKAVTFFPGLCAILMIAEAVSVGMVENETVGAEV